MSPSEVFVDAGGREVRVSSADRVILPATDSTPEITKLAVVTYYVAVGEGILRALHRTRSGFEYRATPAQWHADRRARRPKPAKFIVNHERRRYVQERLAGLVQRPDGVAVGGPDVTWIGRRHGRRKGRRWARSWRPGADLQPAAPGLPR